MAKDFVRTILNTKLTGDKKEPLHTNEQNDLLSDDKDVYVRNQNEYFPITKAILNLTTKSGSILKISTTGKNSRQLDIDLSSIATKEELAEVEKELLNLISGSEIDTSNLATKEELSLKADKSDLLNLKFATPDYVINKIKELKNFINEEYVTRDIFIEQNDTLFEQINVIKDYISEKFGDDIGI